MKYYAGIGSRKTPELVLDLMTAIASKLYFMGDWTLRSGHADGADYAFEIGAGEDSEIYLPWKNFNVTDERPVIGKALLPESWATEIAAKYHPRWKYLPNGAKKLHIRNVHQVLGHQIYSDKSKFVVCWTKNAKGSGGTGQAIRLGQAFEIPVFDLAKPSVCKQWWDWSHTPIDQTPEDFYREFTT